MSSFSLEKSRLHRDLTATFQYIKEADMKGIQRLFARDYYDITRDNSFKLKEVRFKL